MNTELQKCMDTDKDNHIIYFGEIVDAYVLEDKGEQSSQTELNREKFSLYLSDVLRRRISRVTASMSFLMCSTWSHSSMSVRFSSESNTTSSRSHFMKFLDQCVPFLLKRSGYVTPCV